ncbi:MAG: phosphate regulon sensor histidine kinase PhoR [Aquabacterium sp.]
MDTTDSWLLSRVGARLLSAAAGGVAGWVIGDRMGYPGTMCAVGAMSSVLVISVVDTLRGHRLLDWLRVPEGVAPTLPGMWGELAHRMQRVLQLREMATNQERDRLAQFLAAIDASPNGVMLLDASDHIDWISSAAADHFGLNQHRDIQQRVTNLVRQPAFVEYLSNGNFTEPLKCPMGHGSKNCLQVYVRPYGDGLKLVLSQDITERERADTMRRDFVANVSHEIRTPLTVLAGFIETMATLPLTEAERARVLSLMSQQAERMQHLVSDLLTLAQIEGSPRPPSNNWTGVSKLMDRIENDAQGLSRGRHTLMFSLPQPCKLCEISGVESEWLSAMGNLVSNAIRYTPEGGSITVTWSSTPEGSAEFSVRDTGPGIASEHLPRLTERFYRADGSRSRDTGGTGLGLSIVKHVIQRHGGELRITSEVGKGSNFTLHVPASRVRYATPA